MAVRIYALAKELKLDSKELVDICTKAGVPGKGSALASLTEDEAAKVRQFLKGGLAKPKVTKAPPPMPERPAEPVRLGKMPVIVTPKPSQPKPKPTEPVVEAPQPQPRPAESTVAATATATETAVVVEKPRTPGPLAGAMGREKYIGPGKVTGKVPVVGKEPKAGERKKSDGAPPAERARPAVKLAPLPKTSQPIEAAPPAEPPPQKPDLPLPAHLLGMGREGGKPLSGLIRRHEKALEEEKKRTAKGRLPVAPLPEEDEEEHRRGRPRRLKDVPPPELDDDRPLLGGREQRQLARRRQAQLLEAEDRPQRVITRRPRRAAGTGVAAPRKERVTIQLPCTVRELSEAAGVPASDILRVLLNEGMTNVSITSVMDPEITELVAAELGINAEFKHAVSLEEQLLAELEQEESDPSQLVERPPVITFLGHVDHGKTSLLDRIIGIDVVSRESGGITQHIRAYSITKDGRRISFVDTPGHEAFTEMRARGANVTDIAVLVVAADDGVMPQTEEAISHARAAGVPIVVALNKIDLPGINIERVYHGLTANDLLPSEWGGDVEVVKTSAMTGEGIDRLLETLLTVAELHEYKANPNRPAHGTCLEAQLEAERGIVAKVLVQNGTLRVGDVIVCGQAHGRVKAMYDTLDPHRRYQEAGPSIPVNITGLDVAPSAGSRFYVLDDIAKAREIAHARAEQERKMALGASGFRHVTLENLFERLEHTGEVQTLNIILRADVRGSIEAIEKELSKLEHPEVKVKLLQKSVGGITEADVTLAHASDAIIIGFNVVPDEKARTLAERKGVQIRRYDVIYKITDDLKLALEGMLRPEQREVELGRALVQQTFKISRVGTVAGCRVLSGVVERNSRARVIRNSTIIGDYPLETLRREKEDAKEVREGLECGIKLAGFNDVKEGDLLEIYRVEEIHRKFES